MDKQRLEEALSELPLYVYFYIDYSYFWCQYFCLWSGAFSQL